MPTHCEQRSLLGVCSQGHSQKLPGTLHNDIVCGMSLRAKRENMQKDLEKIFKFLGKVFIKMYN